MSPATTCPATRTNLVLALALSTAYALMAAGTLVPSASASKKLINHNETATSLSRALTTGERYLGGLSTNGLKADDTIN